MAACRECDQSMPDESNFCPQCGAPQNEQAARALQEFTERKVHELSPEELEQLMAEDQSTTGGSLERRLRWVIGWVTVVVGLAFLPAGVLFLLAGIWILPPIERLVRQELELELDPQLVAAGYGVGVVVGAILLWLL